MIEYNVLNINLTKFGQAYIKWRKYFFSFKFGVECHFSKTQGKNVITPFIIIIIIILIWLL